MGLEFEIRFEINASPEKVFKALTNSELIQQWCGSKGEVVPNGEFSMFDGWVKGKTTKFEPNYALAYTWKPEDWDSSFSDSLVEYAFSPSINGTLIVLKHSQLPNQEEADSHRQGWYDYVLEPIKEYLET